MGTRTLLLAAGCIALGGCSGARTSTASPLPQAVPSQQADDGASGRRVSELATSFYRAPRPETVTEVVNLGDRALGSVLEEAARDGFQAFLTGWFAVAFERWPERVNDWTSGQHARPMQTVLVEALSLTKGRGDAERLARAYGWSSAAIGRLASTPDHLALARASSGTDLDLFWGAALASGDPRHVEPIITTVMQGERDHGPNAIEAVASEDWERVRAVGPSDEKTIWRVAVVGSALWGLCSHARQHDFVAVAVTRALKRDLTPGARQLLRSC